MNPPTRFMRRPFFVIGFEVTLEDMEALARWCEGHVINTDPDKPFVRVPVYRPANPELTKAYVGTWIVASKHGRHLSFKVYPKDRLDQEFIELFDDEAALYDIEERMEDVLEELEKEKKKAASPRGRSGSSRFSSTNQKESREIPKVRLLSPKEPPGLLT